MDTSPVENVLSIGLLAAMDRRALVGRFHEGKLIFFFQPKKISTGGIVIMPTR